MSKRKLKIMFVVPSLKAGGLERVASELSSFWSENQHAIVELVTLDSKPPFYVLDAGVRLHQSPPIADKLGGWKKAVVLYRWLPKVARKISPDVILSFGEGINAFVLWRLSRIRVPMFVGNRTTPISSLKGVRGAINPIFYRRATKVILQTEKAREILKAKYKRSDFHVIPNPIKQFKISANYNKKRIVTVGSLGGEKNQLVLIKMFQDLSKTFNDWELHIVGEGPNRELLENYVNENSLGNKVSFLGNRNDLAPVFESSSIFAFTSRLEGFPNALGEAMSAGLAVISFDCLTGPAELIRNNQNGILVELDNVQEYQTQLSMLMQSSTIRKELGEKACEDMKQLNIEHIAHRFLNLFQR
jgi:glycosyltransferase involved in cell wall biosynthesis